MSLVSFVVPVYNAEKTIERCVRSLQNQTVDDVEILLIDDGSKDQSLSVCKTLADEDPRIRVIHQENAGVSVARNVGIENAQGTYISFVDADDWIDSNVCEVFSDALKQNDYDLFCFAADYHFGKKHTYTKIFEKSIPLLSDAQREELHLKVMTPWAPGFEYHVKTRFTASAGGKFYRLEILKKRQIEFQKGLTISEDCVFNLLAIEHLLRIGYTSDILYHYEQHEDSAQNSYRKGSMKKFDMAIEIINLWLNQYKKNRRFCDSANTLFFHFIFGTLREDVFHKDNPNTLTYRLNYLKEILEDPFHISILKNVQWSYFSFAEKILVFLLKMKMVRTIAFAMKFVV